MTENPPKYNFLVYIPDLPDEGTFGRRLSLRPVHHERIQKAKEAGFIKSGNPLFDVSVVENPENKKMVGSCIIFEASTLKEVKDYVESDIFFSSGVWDTAKIAYYVTNVKT